MNKFKFISLITALAIVSACTMEEQPLDNEQNRIPEEQITLQASRESDPETRTVRDESNGDVLWTPGDAISLFYGSGTNGGSKFTSNATEISKVTNFTGVITAITGGGEIPVDATYFWGVYPYSEDVSCDGTSVTLTVPSKQTAVPGTFATDLFPSIGRSQGLIMGFYNVCGGWRFSVTKEGVRKVTLKSNNGELITGKVKVGFDDSGIPKVREVIDGSDEVVLECPAGEYFEVGKNYYMIMLPKVFESGFTMTFETYTEKGVYNRAKETTITRSKFSGITDIDNYLTTPYAIKDGGIPIEEDSFKEILVQDYDTDGDGEISYEEAETIETLEIQTSDIESISGIEYMPNLKALICSGSETTTRAAGGPGQLKGLDVSNNMELEYLDCSNNQITRLDVSNNPELETLICTGNPMSEVKMAAGQTISDMQLPDGTMIVYDGVTQEMFPDEGFRTYVFENFDKDGNGFLSYSECNAVTSIDVVTDEIESLEGVEFFPNLERLLAYASVVNHNYQTGSYGTGKLKSLDVSNNPSLKVLTVNGNKLTSINVSNNSALEKLYCEANLLTELDLTHNGELWGLDVADNNLSGLDLSGNNKLVELNCVYCGLSSLDLSNNTALQKFACSYNSLTGIDVSSNTELTKLTVNNNELENLDVSNNINLTSISCPNNQLTSLDVSHNTALKVLRCFSNPDLATVYVPTGQEITITKDDATEILEIVPLEDPVFKNYLLQEYDDDSDGRISSSEALTIDAIKICNQNVTSIKGIEFMPNLTVLECVQTSLQSVDISKNPLLTIVNFNSKYEPNPDLHVNWSFHSGGSISFTPQYKSNLTALDVSSNPAITWLDCTGNSIATLDLSNNTAITDLDCAKNKLSSLDVTNIPDLYWLDCEENELEVLNVTNNPKLFELHCSNNRLSSLNLSNNTKLNTLECYGNMLTALDLSGNHDLVNLTASSNRLSSLDVSTCPKLYDIHISNNMLSSIDISNNPNLRCLDFSSNQVSSFDFSGNPDLEQLRCGSNPIANFNVSANTKLKELDCSNLQLSYLDISNLTALQSLNCKQNNLSSLNLDANVNMTYLTVSDNRLESLSFSSCPSLKQVFCENNLLTSLDVSSNPSLWTLRCSPMNDSSGNNLLSVLYIANGQTINNLTVPESTSIVEK